MAKCVGFRYLPLVPLGKEALKDYTIILRSRSNREIIRLVVPIRDPNRTPLFIYNKRTYLYDPTAKCKAGEAVYKKLPREGGIYEKVKE